MAPIVGAVISAMGALRQADSAKKMAKYNAALGERQAGITRDQTNADLARQRRAARKMLGTMRAQYGAAGVNVEGSPLDVLEESAANAELDHLTLKYRGDLKAQGYEMGAELDRYKGDEAQRAGYMKAAGTLIGAFGGKGGGSSTAGVENYNSYWEDPAG